MKLSEAMRNIHPGALDAIKQAWNDWREALKRAHPPADTDDAAHYAKLDEIADVLEEQFFQFSAARGSGNWSRPRWSVCHSRQFELIGGPMRVWRRVVQTCW